MRVSPSSISGKLKASSSKSYMQRSVFAASLANGISTIENICKSDDSVNALKVIEKLGAKVICQNNGINIEGPIVDKGTEVNVGESGLAMRMLVPILSTLNSEYTITAQKSLLTRKLGFDINCLKGASISLKNDRLPIVIKAGLKSGEYRIDASNTSQFLSGLLFALPLLKGDSIIHVDNLTSKPYIDMSIEILNSFGIDIENKDYKIFIIKGDQKYIPQKIKIEGDWSSAAFMLVAAAITGDVSVYGLNINSLQADKRILEVLKICGADIDIKPEVITIKKAKLEAFDFDATNCPDLFPPLISLAINCKGRSSITGAGRLINKESNRAEALVNEFEKLGAKINIAEDKMIVEYSQLKGGNVFSHNDHRIAMALAVASLNAKNIVNIENSECVSKSYPMFIKDLVSLGADVRIKN